MKTLSALLLCVASTANALDLTVPEEFTQWEEPVPAPVVRLFIVTEEDTGLQPSAYQRTGNGISNANTSSLKGMVQNAFGLPEHK